MKILMVNNHYFNYYGAHNRCLRRHTSEEHLAVLTGLMEGLTKPLPAGRSLK